MGLVLDLLSASLMNGFNLVNPEVRYFLDPLVILKERQAACPYTRIFLTDDCILRLFFFFFDNPDNPDTPEGTRLAPKYTSAEGILEGRFFHSILIDGGQRDSNPDPYWSQSSLKTSGPVLAWLNNVYTSSIAGYFGPTFWSVLFTS